MSNMMRGRTASCGCCRSKPAPQGAERAVERREAERMILEYLAERGVVAWPEGEVVD